MTYTSTTAPEMLVRIGLLQRQIVEASAKGFGSGEVVRLISEMNNLAEDLEAEAVKEYLDRQKVVA
jgi:hypothetical protein